VTKAIGPERTAIRLSPWANYHGRSYTSSVCTKLHFCLHPDMREPHPEETFGYLVSNIKDHYPDLAYIHVIEPPVLDDIPIPLNPEAHLQKENNDFIRDIWQPRPLIVAGGFSGASAKEIVEEKDGLVAFGRHFIANVGSRHSRRDDH